MNNQFSENRKKIADLMPENGVLILHSGKVIPDNNGELYPFSPERNFYYLTGLDTPNILFVLSKAGTEITETLYLEPFDEARAKWTGAPLSKDEAFKISGITSIKDLDEFEPDKKKKRKNFDSLFARLRLIKSDYEIENIEKAVKITENGFRNIFAAAKPGMYEYELEAHFNFALKSAGLRPAFPTIIASGKNAAVLHYNKNNTKTENGDLILVDAGASYNYYSADITRTFPINGRFTQRQKELYNIVLEGQLKIIDAVKPGLPFSELNNILLDFYARELKAAKIIKTKDDIGDYYYHNVSHMLGLLTHDVGRGSEGELKPGMVLTVEPGLYIKKEKTGIRIEDDILVTESGCRVLSSGIPKTVDEIEKNLTK